MSSPPPALPAPAWSARAKGRTPAPDRGPRAVRPARAREPVAAGARVPGGRWRDVALAVTAVALSLWVYRSAPGGYFSPDDLIYLERVRGLVPEPPTLWRYLSGVAYFRTVFPLFGADPFPYMVTNWLLHGLTVAALYTWVRSQGGGPLAATVAAALFGTSRLFLTVVSQVVTVAEPLAMLLAFAALSLARRSGWPYLLGALVAFTAALLCKETVMLLPLVLLLPGPGAGPLRARAVRYAVLMAPSVLMLAYLSDPRVHAGIFVNDVYQRAYGMNLFHNLMMLTDWAFDLQTPVPDFLATLSTTAWHTGLWITLGLAVLAALAWRTITLPALGTMWWLLALAPVLPLLTQRYLHYLYMPMAGCAMALGAGLEWALLTGFGRSAASRAPRRAGARRAVIAWTLAAALILGHVTMSDALLRERAAPRLSNVDLPVDPFMRKRETARRAVVNVGRAIAGRRVSAVFVIPESAWSWRLAGIFRSILGEGRALRAVQPGLDSVAFVRRWTPAYRDFELFYGRVDGNVVDLGRGPAAHLRLAQLLIGDRCEGEARDHLAAALEVYPDDLLLQALYARLVHLPAGGDAAAPPR